MNWDNCLLGIESMGPHYGMASEDLKFCFDVLHGDLDHPVIVELGVCHGRSSAMLAYLAQQAAGRYIGIDNWSLEGSLQEVDDGLDALGLPHELHEGDSRTFPWVAPIDVLLIDAGHDEANVSVDCAHWIPRLAPGGYVIFDDWPASSEIREDNPHWAVAHYGDLFTRGWAQWRNGRVMVRRAP